MERQKHGFVYQTEIIESLDLAPTASYTDKWDAYCGSIPVSIKTTRLGGDIELGDYFRQAAIKEDFFMVFPSEFLFIRSLKMRGTTKSLGQKEANDKFYTKPEIAQKLLSFLDLAQYDLIIEPAAGNGSFSKQIPNCIALDILPEDDSIEQKDFFSFSPAAPFSNCLVIGNPPFGQQSTQAIKFFNHAAQWTHTIAFIVPKSFRKVSIQNRLSLDFWLKTEVSMEENAFTLNGIDYSVPCIFQIWQRRDQQRSKISLPMKSSLFEFTKDIEKANFRVQRVGGNAGKAFLDKNGAVASNYYLINTSRYETKFLIESINSINFPSIENTVGPKSLPKGEFIYEVECYLKTLF